MQKSRCQLFQSGLLGLALLIVINGTGPARLSSVPGGAANRLASSVESSSPIGILTTSNSELDGPLSAEVRNVIERVFRSGDHGTRAVAVLDKKEARLYVFSSRADLLGASPVLIGSAIGDGIAPGVGSKAISDVMPSERTTPAGRFVLEPGKNHQGEDVLWVDYDAAISMHRVRPANKTERRLERLATSTPRDNRISYGCINVPLAFFEEILSPTAQASGVVLYVLPEMDSPEGFVWGPAPDR